MNSYFDKAILFTLRNEDHTYDKGNIGVQHLGDGKTTFLGLTQEDDGDILPPFLEGSIKNLYSYYQENMDDAIECIKEIYYEKYWLKSYNEINSYIVAAKLFDMGVLCGVGTAVRLMQSVLNSMGASLTEDGKFGPKTLFSINSFLDEGKEDILYNRYLKKHEERFRSLRQFDKFGDGWLARLDRDPNISNW